MDDGKKNRIGRPATSISLGQLEMLARYGATEKEICSFFEVDAVTIRRLIRKSYNSNFVAFRESQIAKMKYTFLNKVYNFVNKELDKGGRINAQLTIAIMKYFKLNEDEKTSADINVFSSTPTVILSLDDHKDIIDV